MLKKGLHYLCWKLLVTFLIGHVFLFVFSLYTTFSISVRAEKITGHCFTPFITKSECSIIANIICWTSIYIKYTMWARSILGKFWCFGCGILLLCAFRSFEAVLLITLPHPLFFYFFLSVLMWPAVWRLWMKQLKQSRSCRLGEKDPGAERV